MQSHWVNGAPYYRCGFPAEYALANHVEHPLNVNPREDAVIGHVDHWLAREAEKAGYALAARKPEPRPRMTEAEIKALVDKLAEIAAVLHDAHPDDKADVLRQLGLKLTYHPRSRLVAAEAKIPVHWYSESVRGGLELGNR
jgi:hypothetical protein